MSIPIVRAPPPARTSYIIDQLEGERLTMPGSKGVFRILASSKQTNGGIAVFTSGAVAADAPGFHWHGQAYDIFLVTKGFMKLWNGGQCRILGPGDFAYVPPKVIHNAEPLGPHTELFGLVAPGDWIDFFRYVGETYDGVVVPEHDDRDLHALMKQKMMATHDRFDVQFEPTYQPPDVAEWDGSENKLAEPGQPYFLRANTGPRWLLGGLLSRPFVLAGQCSAKFSVASIESSNSYDASERPLARWLTFAKVDHCFCLQEGLLRVRLAAAGDWTEVREGQTLVVAARETFTLDFGSRFVRLWSFTNGHGLEELVRLAGAPTESFVLPDTVREWDESEFLRVCKELNVEVSSL